MTSVKYRSAGQEVQIKRDFLLPLAIIAGLVILSLTLGVHFAVRAFDRESMVREQSLARNGIDQRIEEVALMVVPQADWDDAIRNLDIKYNSAWAEANLGKFLSATNGFDQSFVLDSQNLPIFASENGTVVSSNAFRVYEQLSDKLLTSVRVQERSRGKLEAGNGRDLVSRPIQASALKIVEGQLKIVTATLVQPDFGTALPTGPRAPIVLTAMNVDKPFLDQFSKRFLLEDFAVRSASEPAGDGRAQIAASDETGKTIAYFSWRPLNPGYTMLRQLAPPVLAVSLLLLSVGYFQLRHIRRAAQNLLERETFAWDLAYRDPVTGLPNRNAFEEHLEWELASLQSGSSSVGVTYLRFPHLVHIFERFGSEGPDQFVSILASRLSAACRSDSLLARLSGNEFAIISISDERGDVFEFAKRLRPLIAAPVALAGEQLELAFELGASATENTMSAADLTHQAMVAALHESRENGRRTA